MTKYLVEEETLSDIADAIREQTGDVNPMRLADFASNVRSISGGSMNFSQSEQVVGTWIDGKPLYQKTLIANATSTSATTYTDTGVDNIDTLFFNPCGTFKVQNTSNNVVAQSFYSSADDRLQIYYRSSSNEVSVLSIGSNFAGTIYITICYTKTTDNATVNAQATLLMGGLGNPGPVNEPEEEEPDAAPEEVDQNESDE